jgi:hypothetical protein
MRNIDLITTHRTPNPDCPYCQAKKLHPRYPVDELRKYHPDAGTGVDLRDSRKAKGQQ